MNIKRFKGRLEGHGNPDATYLNYLKRVGEISALSRTSLIWSRYRNFWPPTVISALRTRRLVAFMGAGVSVAAKLPSWRDLLESRLGISAEFLADENLKVDNLTLGEIAARLIGREQLQYSLRSVYGASHAEPTLIHYSLAALELPVYITTNYDGLFEQAWKTINQSAELSVICNTSDLHKHQAAKHKLYKIHGSTDRLDEMLVLTRSDYRQHYRNNSELFSDLRLILEKCPTLFTGFSHTDPEVGRLIDDVIYAFEQTPRHPSLPASEGPALYNLQFENTYVSNERFAAKGMVSLTVRMGDVPDADIRTAGVAEAIAELADATGIGMDRETDLDKQLNDITLKLKTDLDGALAALKPAADCLAAGGTLDPDRVEAAFALIDMSKALATQGVYIVDGAGSLIEKDGKRIGCLYGDLDSVTRDNIIDALDSSFNERPYFQSAKSFRKPFISDLFASAFNGNSTFAICYPIVHDHKFLGLVFSACQVGQWKLPIALAQKVEKNLGLYIMDGQGTVAIPPRREFSEQASDRPVGETVECKFACNSDPLEGGFRVQS